MNTEDDTFRRLKRCSYTEMWNYINCAITTPSPTETFNLHNVLNKHGWTYEEYLNEARVYQISQWDSANKQLEQDDRKI